MTTGGSAPPLVFAVDELRLLARLTGAPLPSALDTAWPDADQAVVDVVAARCLLARGALALGAPPDTAPPDALPPDTVPPGTVPSGTAVPDAPRGGPNGAGPRVSAAIDRLFAPLREAVLVLETACRGRSGAPGRQVAVAGPVGGLLMLEREPDVWRLTPDDDAVSTVLDGLFDALSYACAGPPVSFTVPADVLERARRLHLAGWRERARELLRSHGVTDTVAASWLSALAAGQVEVRARAARRDGVERYTLAEVAWWDAGRQGLWRTVGADDHDGADEVTVSGADPDELRAAVLDLGDLTAGVRR